MSEEKREIRAHKGGRTARIELTLTPEGKSKLILLKKKHGVSASDLVEGWIKKAKL